MTTPSTYASCDLLYPSCEFSKEELSFAWKQPHNPSWPPIKSSPIELNDSEHSLDWKRINKNQNYSFANWVCVQPICQYVIVFSLYHLLCLWAPCPLIGATLLWWPILELNIYHNRWQCIDFDQSTTRSSILSFKTVLNEWNLVLFSYSYILCLPATNVFLHKTKPVI